MKKVLALALFLLLTISNFAVGQILIENPQPSLVILGNPYLKYFSLPEGEEYTAYFYVIEDLDIENVTLYYRVNYGEWQTRPTKVANINENEEIYNSIVSRIYNRSAIMRTFYGKATIPAQEAGSVVEFKVVVKDKEGHISESIIGKYFVVNPSGKRVLIVDPSVKEELYLEGAENVEVLINATEEYPVDLSDYQAKLDKVKPFLKHQRFLKRHHWEYLARYYNITIVTPEELPTALKEVQPSVVILSNLWMKRWEIPNIQILIEYLRKNNAGLIATHGTLFDGLVYTGDRLIQTGPAPHIGTFEAYEQGSLATLLGLELLPVIEETKIKAAEKENYAISEIPAMLPFIPSPEPLLVKNMNVIKSVSSLNFSNETYSAFGWQYLLLQESMKFARERIRERKRIEKGKILEFFELQKEIFGYSNPSRGIYAMDFPLVDALRALKFTDDEIWVQIGATIITLTPNRPVLERVRLLSAINQDIVSIDAISKDYLSTIITRGEKHREDGIRSVYISFEIEAGEEQEFLVLKDMAEWASNFEPIETFAPIVQVAVLSNDIDWNIKGQYIKEHFEKLGAMVTRVKPSEFEAYKKNNIIIILGGPKAYEGVGEYVKQVLDEEEQKKIINGKQGIFIKRDVWSKGQIVIVLAGKDRYQTGEKVLTYSKGVNEDYVNLLAEFLTS
ncbi:hypothetical protein NF865_04650 [Thermococcus aggregans]|uniref:S-layer protein C-terminal domain-containing protein n=1 Tax=Thermococcus aggregans TaxID=110163 RepID=A0A9E7MZ70_THEAG|nr:hypothetical protein [Thermococcus aggregans]USS41467.1 hypothetical protein NF865_04650 [Thermococcus aggregans]